MSYGGRVRIAKLYDDWKSLIGQEIRVGGWAKSTRFQKEFCFVELNDGSCFKNLQVVVNKTISGFDDVSKAIVGASFMFKGTLIESPAKGQDFELQVNDDSKHNAKVVGHSSGTYPIQGRPKLETLREQAHLRPRTNTFGAVTRVRNSLAFATHTFFQTRGFLYIHTPIITASDCEGAGEMF
jgi:asparaginyl-tRNA synthetase